MSQSALDRARSYQAELTAIRRDIHAHPELGLEEYRTAELVARKLEEWGIEVHRGVGKTGVVGVLRNGNGQDAVGLRADMDALPILEATGLPHASQNPGRMHACGHDGHTTMLLGAAKYLAETRNFNGTVNFIFQPAEEGVGGALEMLKDGLFERFPCNYVYGMHNRPGLPVGKFITGPTARAAGGAFFDITITGKGAHGAHPQQSIDPVVVACHLGTALQSIVSRNISAQDTAVLSITRIQAGDAYNVIPQQAVLAGTVRTMKREIMADDRAQHAAACDQPRRRVRRRGKIGFPRHFRADGEQRGRGDCLRRRSGGPGGRGECAPRWTAGDGVGRFQLHDGAGAGRAHQLGRPATPPRCITIGTISTTRRSRTA